MLFIEALQFVAPTPERRDMDVVARARKERVEAESVTRKRFEYKGLREGRAPWPVACF
jgi:hypothetical protein